ncbi:MAG: RNA repair transcriptional activator RtcR [Planctomycetales bacterium]
MNQKPVVVIGLIGAVLDAGAGRKRWEKWRPTVSLCRHEELLVSRLELLYQEKFAALTEAVAEDVSGVSPETDVRLSRIDLDDAWDFEEVYAALHDFARDYPFDPDNEEYLVHITTGSHVAQICLFLLTESRRLPARLLQTSPPRRKTSDSPGAFTIIDLDLSRYDLIASRFQQEQQEGVSFLKAGIETRNEGFNQLMERIEHVATASKAPLLLTGPTGAGKSRLAKRIYELKKNRRLVEGAMVEINCATIRGDGAMSALFGHVAGAFTGAVGARPGLLRQANGGLLFLDEIGELGLDEQAMLLRAVEEKRFLPVGADEETGSEFQLLAGTNRDLWAEVKAGRFREDLLARIHLWTFRLPGLRERREDVEPNLQFELEAFARTQGTRTTFNKPARKLFLDFAVSSDALWSANFRDLNAAVVRMATLAPGGRITEEVVREEIERLQSHWRVADPHSSDALLEEILAPERIEQLDRFDRVQLADVLRVCRESKSLSAAGRTLFAQSRKDKQSVNDSDRLRKYLARFGVRWSDLA